MGPQPASDTTGKGRRRRRTIRLAAILVAAFAVVGGLALNPLQAEASHGVDAPPGYYGYAGFYNNGDGSEVVYVCDTRSDSYRIFATFRFSGSTEQPLWAPQGDCATRMPVIPEGQPVRVRVCATNLNGYPVACNPYYTLLGYA